MTTLITAAKETWARAMRPNIFLKCMKLNWNFQRGGEVLGKIPSVW